MSLDFCCREMPPDGAAKSFAFPTVFLFIFPGLNIWNATVEFPFQNFFFCFFCTDSCCVNTQMKPSGILMSQKREQNPYPDLPQRWFGATVLSSENGQFEQQRAVDVRGLLHEGGMVFKHRDAGSALLLSVFLSLGEAHGVLFTFLKMLCSYFFRHAVVLEIMKIYRTFCRSKAKEFAFGESALFSFPSSPSLN